MNNIIDLNGLHRVPAEGHSSKGDQPKWQIKEEWYKADYMGYEALSEIIVSEILKKSNISEFVIYEPVWICYDGKEAAGCKSKNFRTTNEMLIPLERLHRAFFGEGLVAVMSRMDDISEKIQYTVRFIEQNTNLKDVGKYFTLLLELDSFILNEDRHTNNIAVLRNEDTKQFRLCPVFDNGLSLLSDLNDYPLNRDVYQNISSVQAKPFCADFDTQVEAAEQLYGSQLRLQFSKRDFHGVIWNLQEYYSTEILERVETVLLEQCRKYPVYFR